MLLRQVGIEPVVVPSHVVEDAIEGESPEDAALRLAVEKAREVSRQFQEGLVIGADTVVVIDGEQLGKPKDKDDARRMLRLISGKTHTVVTGLAVIDAGTSDAKTATVRTRVRLKLLKPKKGTGYFNITESMFM